MALTKNGNRTGRAGALDLADQRMMIWAGQEKQADQNCEDFTAVRDALVFLDPAGWSKWYDENVPDWLGWMHSKPAVDVMEARVKELLVGRDLFNGTNEADVDSFLEIVAGLVHESTVAQMEVMG